VRLTRSGDYAVRAVIHLAMQESDNLSTLMDISISENIPQSFLAKVMQVLSKAGLVNAYRGKKGGFSLAKNADKITIRDVVEAVEGPVTLNNCLSGDGECERDSFCAAHPVWREAQEALLDVLDDYTIEMLAQKQKENLTK
jgi:Rrf2 family iron-sulfur cluster assembly transcriptional regulator